MYSSLKAVAPIATPQVAASVITTALLTPVLTTYITKQKNKNSVTENKSL
ncbi:MAG: hypothetical protein GX376_05575 [Firmicutes bacterium]|nr:hypothetical protein [Bacillota bacterium]